MALDVLGQNLSGPIIPCFDDLDLKPEHVLIFHRPSIDHIRFVKKAKPQPPKLLGPALLMQMAPSHFGARYPA